MPYMKNAFYNIKRFIILVGFTIIFMQAGLVQAANPPTINVSATSSISVEPDQAKINLKIESFGLNLPKAESLNNLETTKLINALIGAGIKKEAILNGVHEITPEYAFSSSGTKALTGYRVNNQVQILVNNISLLGDILEWVHQAGAQDITYISFEKANLQQIQERVREKAQAKAQANAETIAEATGMKLGPIIDIKTSYNTSYPLDGMLIKNPGYSESPETVQNIPVTAIKIDATINIVFSLE